MNTTTEPMPIPAEEARRLCEEIYRRNRGRWWTVGGLWCWGCAAFTKPPTKRCWANAPGNRGCAQVAARFDRVTGR